MSDSKTQIAVDDGPATTLHIVKGSTLSTTDASVRSIVTIAGVADQPNLSSMWRHCLSLRLYGQVLHECSAAAESDLP